MKLVTVRQEGGTRTGLLEDEAVVLVDDADVGALLQRPDWHSVTAGDGPRVPLAECRLGPVVPHPPRVFCIGLNYTKHILEMGRELPEHPTIFSKFASSLCGPHDTVKLPPESSRVDWEAELAVVIGRPGRRVTPEEALDLVAGYTVLNDVSMRDWQNRSTQWLAGKAWDRSSPLGPALVTADELPSGASGLRITCTVNDEVVQDDNTADLLFDVATLVADISVFTTLLPGDVIATGTPGGVGAGHTPPRFLKPGDRVRTAIEGIGELDNLVATE